MAKADLTAQRLRELLHYEPETGVFTWRVNKGRAKAGQVAGRVHQSYGYRYIKVDQQNVRENRAAWAYVTGEWPPTSIEIDHVNRKRDDNSWANLRFVTPKQNRENQSDSRRNTSGNRGVRFDTQRGLWHAQIGHFGKVYNLGRYKTISEALDARRIAEQEFFTHSMSPTQAIPSK